jgi:hypothetical protein
MIMSHALVYNHPPYGTAFHVGLTIISTITDISIQGLKKEWEPGPESQTARYVV